MTETLPGRKPMDWQRLRQRLVKASEALQAALEPSPETVRERLDARALALAKPIRSEEATADRIEVITWRVMKDRFALETAYVREIAKVRDLTVVPRSPAFLAGICNVRGEIMPVFDLRKLFSNVPNGMSDLSYAIIVGRETGEFGILADSVEQVMSLPCDAIVASRALAGRGAGCIRGMTAAALAVLDGEALLAEPALFIGG